MSDDPQEIPRRRLRELAMDPAYTPFIVGYLVSGWTPSQIDALVQAALEFREAIPAPESRYQAALVNIERWARG